MNLMGSHSHPSSVEIQLLNCCGQRQNVVLLKGTRQTAAAVNLRGNLILALNDFMSVKKVTIKLLGILKIRALDPAQLARLGGSYPLLVDRIMYEKEVQVSLPSPAHNEARSSRDSEKTTPGSSMSNLQSYFQQHLSSSSLSLSKHSSSVIHLSAGTHKFPFEMIIPGDVKESIEGNESAQLIHWLVVTVERGRFQHNLVSRKHIHLVRTLGIDTFDVAYTVSIDNTWPKKCEYNIHIPSKAVAIGSTVEVGFNIIPLAKGLQLGPMRILLKQFTTLHIPGLKPISEEKNVVSMDYTVSLADDAENVWVFSKLLPVPPSLTHCTQTCQVKPYLKISHKLFVYLSLANYDGHVSELRASLPVFIYISPQIPVLAKDVQALQEGHKNAPEEVVFPSVDPSPDEELGAPPNYLDHVYDRLWSDIATPIPEPLMSSSCSLSANRSLSNLDSAQEARLVEHLNALALSRQDSLESIPRTAQFTLDVEALSKVPSYSAALQDEAQPETAPAYQN